MACRTRPGPCGGGGLGTAGTGNGAPTTTNAYFTTRGPRRAHTPPNCKRKSPSRRPSASTNTNSQPQEGSPSQVSRRPATHHPQNAEISPAKNRRHDATTSIYPPRKSPLSCRRTNAAVPTAISLMPIFPAPMTARSSRSVQCVVKVADRAGDHPSAARTRIGDHSRAICRKSGV